MGKLAINGGEPIRSEPFPPHPVIGEEEKKAVAKVMESGHLSDFVASPKNFLGGRKVREFEDLFCEYFNIKYAVSFNSATSALHAAVVAVGVDPCHEVLVPPYTFSATATCALMHNAIPAFADIDPDTFCIDPECIDWSSSILSQAVISVHLFGHPADMDGIMDVAKKRKLKVIEDCAQSPGATYKGQKVGTIGDCGIFSFTQSKTIMTGEGGMLITDDEEIAEKARLVRNHGEVIPGSTTLGWNYRMTEIQAAIGIEQLKKLDFLNTHRINLACYLNDKLGSIDGFKLPETAKSVCWGYAMKYNEEKVRIPRDKFVEALNAEGVPFNAGYVKPLYMMDIYQKRAHFAFRHYLGNASYKKGICSVTERMHYKELILTFAPRFPATENDMSDIVNAIYKILTNKKDLINNES